MAGYGRDRFTPDGRFEIWYYKPEYSRDAGEGYEFLADNDLLPNIKKLEKTHALLGRLDVTGDNTSRCLDDVFHDLQGEVWSPRGEARDLIREKDLWHTSMSVGDIVVDTKTGDVHLVDRIGFQYLGTLGAGEKPVTVNDLLNRLLPYISGDDVALSTEEFLKVVADRIQEDLQT